MLISFGVFGTLTVQEVIDNGETALALAATPALGDAGFAMMAVAALLATSSSVNANIYAATGSTAKLAESGMFPPVFGARARVGGTRGLVISVVLILLLANLVDLTAIASLGSAVALAIFLVTSVAAYKLKGETGSRTLVLVAGIVLTSLVLLVFGVQTLRTAPQTFVAMVAILLLAAGAGPGVVSAPTAPGRLRGRVEWPRRVHPPGTTYPRRPHPSVAAGAPLTPGGDVDDRAASARKQSGPAIERDAR